MTAVLDRPVDDIESIGEGELPCDSRTVDPKARPRVIISKCDNPAEWLYIMKCCRARVMACHPCHERHMHPAPYNQDRYCIHCEAPFTTLGASTVGVYRI